MIMSILIVIGLPIILQIEDLQQEKMGKTLVKTTKKVKRTITYLNSIDYNHLITHNLQELMDSLRYNTL